MLEDFLWWVDGKKWPARVCVFVSPSVEAFLPLEPEEMARSGRANNIHSLRRNDGKTMVTVSDRSVARGTCDLANPCKQVVAQVVRQTNGRIQLKLGGPMATIRGQNLLGDMMMLPSWQVPQARAK